MLLRLYSFSSFNRLQYIVTCKIRVSRDQLACMLDAGMRTVRTSTTVPVRVSPFFNGMPAAASSPARARIEVDDDERGGMGPAHGSYRYSVPLRYNYVRRYE